MNYRSLLGFNRMPDSTDEDDLIHRLFYEHPSADGSENVRNLYFSHVNVKEPDTFVERIVLVSTTPFGRANFRCTPVDLSAFSVTAFRNMKSALCWSRYFAELTPLICCLSTRQNSLATKSRAETDQSG